MMSWFMSWLGGYKKERRLSSPCGDSDAVCLLLQPSIRFLMGMLYLGFLRSYPVSHWCWCLRTTDSRQRSGWSFGTHPPDFSFGPHPLDFLPCGIPNRSTMLSVFQSFFALLLVLTKSFKEHEDYITSSSVVNIYFDKCLGRQFATLLLR